MIHRMRSKPAVKVITWTNNCISQESTNVTIHAPFRVNSVREKYINYNNGDAMRE